MKPVGKEQRAFEESCARELTELLCERHRLPLDLLAVSVAADWKIAFTFRPWLGEPWKVMRVMRYGRRPGLEIRWLEGAGDVDAWQYDGDVLSLITHGFWQILREKFTGRCERPSKLLAVFEKQEKKITRRVEE